MSPEIQKLLFAIENNQPSLVSVNLAEKQISDSGVIALSHALKKNTQVRYLNLHKNNIGPDGATALAEMLKNNRVIEEVNLGFNRIGAIGAHSLGEALKVNDTLTALQLNNNRLGNHGTEELTNGLRFNTHLKVLNLHFNQIGNLGLKAVRKLLKLNTPIEELSLSSNFFTEKGVIDLCEDIRFNTHIQGLVLSDCDIGKKGTKALCGLLKSNTTLKRLDLCANHIGAYEANLLCKTLSTNSNLIELNLASNVMGDEGAKAIAQLIQTNTSLRKLDVSTNEINKEGLEAIVQSLQSNTNLTHFNFKESSLIDEALNLLCHPLEFNFTLLSCSNLNRNKKIDDLIQRNNRLHQELAPLFKAVESRTLLSKKQDLRLCLKAIAASVHDMDSLSDDSYPKQAFRLLNALSIQQLSKRKEALNQLSSTLAYAAFKNYIPDCISQLDMKIALDEKNWAAILKHAKNPINLSLKGKTGHTAIELAAEADKLELVCQLSELIQKTDNCFDAAEVGKAILVAAAKRRFFLNLLTIQNINKDCYDLHGPTAGFGALHHAFSEDDNWVFREELLHHGYDVNARHLVEGGLGPSPLQVAMQKKDRSAIYLLISHKASLDPLIESNSCQINTIAEMIIKESVDHFNQDRNSNFTISLTTKNRLKKALIKELLSCDRFLNEFVFDDRLLNSPEKKIIMQGIAQYIAHNQFRTPFSFFPFFCCKPKVGFIELVDLIILNSWINDSLDLKPLDIGTDAYVSPNPIYHTNEL